MGAIYADEMVSFVRGALGGVDSDVMTDNFILRLLNLSYLEVITRGIFNELETSTTVSVTASTTEYELSVSNVLAIQDVVDTTNGLRLEKIDRRRHTEITQGLTTQTGKPVYWFLSGVGSNDRLQITIYPTPAASATLTVWYKKSPTSLALSPAATATVLRDQFDEPIMNLAIKKGHYYLRRYQDAGAVQALTAAQRNAAGASTSNPSEVPYTYTSPVGAATRGKP